MSTKGLTVTNSAAKPKSTLEELTAELINVTADIQKDPRINKLIEFKGKAKELIKAKNIALTQDEKNFVSDLFTGIARENKDPIPAGQAMPRWDAYFIANNLKRGFTPAKKMDAYLQSATRKICRVLTNEDAREEFKIQLASLPKKEVKTSEQKECKKQAKPKQKKQKKSVSSSGQILNQLTSTNDATTTKPTTKPALATEAKQDSKKDSKDAKHADTKETKQKIQAKIIHDGKPTPVAVVMKATEAMGEWVSMQQYWDTLTVGAKLPLDTMLSIYSKLRKSNAEKEMFRIMGLENVIDLLGSKSQEWKSELFRRLFGSYFTVEELFDLNVLFAIYASCSKTTFAKFFNSKNFLDSDVNNVLDTVAEKLGSDIATVIESIQDIAEACLQDRDGVRFSVNEIYAFIAAFQKSPTKTLFDHINAKYTALQQSLRLDKQEMNFLEQVKSHFGYKGYHYIPPLQRLYEACQFEQAQTLALCGSGKQTTVACHKNKIPAGAIIAFYIGDERNIEDQKSYSNPTKYDLIVRDKNKQLIVVSAMKRGNITRFIKPHKDQSKCNCDLRYAQVGDKVTLFFMAIKEIKPGEEIYFSPMFNQLDVGCGYPLVSEVRLKECGFNVSTTTNTKSYAAELARQLHELHAQSDHAQSDHAQSDKTDSSVSPSPTPTPKILAL